MATFNPPSRLFETQVGSIRAQTADRLGLHRLRRRLRAEREPDPPAAGRRSPVRVRRERRARRLLPELRAGARPRSARRPLRRVGRPGRSLVPAQDRASRGQGWTPTRLSSSSPPTSTWSTSRGRCCRRRSTATAAHPRRSVQPVPRQQPDRRVDAVPASLLDTALPFPRAFDQDATTTIGWLGWRWLGAESASCPSRCTTTSSTGRTCSAVAQAQRSLPDAGAVDALRSARCSGGPIRRYLRSGGQPLPHQGGRAATDGRAAPRPVAGCPSSCAGWTVSSPTRPTARCSARLVDYVARIARTGAVGRTWSSCSSLGGRGPCEHQPG